MGQGSIAVMVVSQRYDLLAALAGLLVAEPDLRLAGSAASIPADMEAAESLDVLLADEALLLRDEAAIERLRQRNPRMRVLAWCDKCTDALLAAVLDHQLDGFVLVGDPSPTLLKAMRFVHEGELWMPRAMMAELVRKCMRSHSARDGTHELADTTRMLTLREAEVVRHLRQGFTNKQIGRELGIMEDTVKKHLTSVFAKLGVHRRTLVIARPAPERPHDR